LSKIINKIIGREKRDPAMRFEKASIDPIAFKQMLIARKVEGSHGNNKSQ
jgi:hypothetical protein